MEFKYFSFYKSISNFSTNLVGVFLPLMIYNYTGKFYLAIIFYILENVLGFTFSTLLKKQIYRRPQILILFRAIPFFLYSLCVILLEYNVLAFAIPLCVFYALNVAMSVYPEEIILNYSSDENYSSNLGISDFLTYLFAALSTFAGGFILDNLNALVLTIISVSLYAISTIPLVMFYIKNKNKSDFNKELTSNAVELDINKERKNQTKISLIVRYCVILGLTFSIDASIALSSLLMYTKYNLFTIAATVTCTANLVYGISSLIVGKINETKDITFLAKYSAFICAILILMIAIFDNAIVLIVCISLLAMLEPNMIVYLSDKMIQKTRILGVSNSALFHYANSFYVPITVSLLIGLTGVLTPSFILCAMGISSVGFMIEKHEDKTSDILINYLDHVESDVEIIAKPKKRKSRKPR